MLHSECYIKHCDVTLKHLMLECYIRFCNVTISNVTLQHLMLLKCVCTTVTVYGNISVLKCLPNIPWHGPWVLSPIFHFSLPFSPSWLASASLLLCLFALCSLCGLYCLCCWVSWTDAGGDVVLLYSHTVRTIPRHRQQARVRSIPFSPD